MRGEQLAGGVAGHDAVAGERADDVHHEPCVGQDRIGDANQLTTSVSTGLYRDSDGQEKLRLSLGQIQYFKDRRVNLGNKPVEKQGRSLLVSEGLYQIDQHWRLYGLTFWDTQKHRPERDVISLDYQLDNDRFIKLAHHYGKGDYNQTTLAATWRINPQWRLFYRSDYSHRHHRLFNHVSGVEYNDCCWAWRLAGKHWRDRPGDDRDPGHQPGHARQPSTYGGFAGGRRGGPGDPVLDREREGRGREAPVGGDEHHPQGLR